MSEACRHDGISATGMGDERPARMKHHSSRARPGCENRSTSSDSCHDIHRGNDEKSLEFIRATPI
jgi:hypothetical protein